jgi:hypothetical protein
MRHKLGEGEEREEMLLKLTRSTLRVLKISLRVSSKAWERDGERSFLLLGFSRG